MFAKTIIDSDLFLDMPQSSQLLYFHLSMRADDDGFINNPKSVMRNVRCNEDDLKLLIAKQLLIPFDTGIVVIKHWKIHNYIRNDRYKQTKCIDEFNQISTDDNNIYNLGIPNVNQVTTKQIPNGDNLDTQVRLGKVSIGKDSINNIVKLYTSNDELANTIKYFIDMRNKLKKAMTIRAIELMLKKLDRLAKTDEEKINILNQSILGSWTDIYAIKAGDKFGTYNKSFGTVKEEVTSQQRNPRIRSSSGE
jgi:hypothetical protein